MSPRRSKKKSGQSGGKKNVVKKNDRVPLSDEIKQYMTISPHVSVPQIIVSTVLRDDAQPAVSKNGSPLYRLPTSKNSVMAGIFSKCTAPKPKDIRDDDSNKLQFLSALDLIDKETADRIAAKTKNSYGRRQRVTRQLERTMGLSSNSCALLSACRDCAVRVQNLTDGQVARKMQEVQNQNAKSFQKPAPAHPEIRWIASEPTAGPSWGMERIAIPVIRLYQIRKSPTKVKFFL